MRFMPNIHYCLGHFVDLFEGDEMIMMESVGGLLVGEKVVIVNEISDSMYSVSSIEMPDGFIWLVHVSQMRKHSEGGKSCPQYFI